MERIDARASAKSKNDRRHDRPHVFPWNFDVPMQCGRARAAQKRESPRPDQRRERSRRSHTTIANSICVLYSSVDPPLRFLAPITID